LAADALENLYVGLASAALLRAEQG
jgi:hypothetical protein